MCVCFKYYYPTTQSDRPLTSQLIDRLPIWNSKKNPSNVQWNGKCKRK